MNTLTLNSKNVYKTCLKCRNSSTIRELRRIVVTGLGAITPVGLNVESSWNTIEKGGCGIQCLSEEYHNLPCRIAGLIVQGAGQNELDITKHFTKTEIKTMTTATRYAMIAAKEALDDANWYPKEDKFLQMTGVAVGMGMVDLEEICKSNDALKKGYNKVNPFFVPRILPNMAAGQISMKFGFRGPNHSVSTACATGAHSIGDAFRFIRSGDADIMVCGGAEACINPLAIAGFCRIRALSTNKNNVPQKASRPFDKDRDGFVMGEGSGILILEELHHALERKAKIYAEVLGYGLSGDASHLTAPREDGTGAVLAMTRALQDANVKFSDVGYINAHATSTPIGDAVENRAIKLLFGDHSKNLYVSSTKGAHGHLLGAAGNIETIFTIMALKTGIIPPTLNIDNLTPDMDLNYVPNKSCTWITKDSRKIAIKNSFGFGGTNASLCLAEYI